MCLYNLKNTLKTFLRYMIKEAKENYYKYNDFVLTETKKKKKKVHLSLWSLWYTFHFCINTSSLLALQ